MKTARVTLTILSILCLGGTVYSQSTPSRPGVSPVQGEFYGSSCPGDSMRVEIYSLSGSLISTLVLPDDAQSAVFSDSSRMYKDLGEFRGKVTVKTISCRDRAPVAGQHMKDYFVGAPVELTIEEGFVIVYFEE